jgi:hypothetical protein
MSLFELPLIINDDDHPMQTQIEKKFGKEMSVTVLSRCVLANRLFGHLLLPEFHKALILVKMQDFNPLSLMLFLQKI